MENRRSFVKKIALTTASLSLFPIDAISFSKESKLIQLTILHTNDMHSHIEPFSSGDYKGLGGMAQRSSIVKKIRSEGNGVLLFDAGDIFQGTPYYNFFKGELELKLMSEIGYDASTIGNHDFDYGVDELVKQSNHSNFPFIISNYDFSKNSMHNNYLKYKVFNKSGIKVGVFGIGIELDGLVPRKLYMDTVYQDPVQISNYYANYLKNIINCDLVICLSHLGYQYNGNKVSDRILASKTKNIDLIIGGHTHTFLDYPVFIKDLDQNKVQIAQVGWGGINIGRIDYFFSKKRSLKKIKTKSILIKK